MLNTVLGAKQCPRPVIHIKKQHSQKRKGDRQAGSKPKPVIFFHLFFIYYFYCEEGAGDTKPHTIRSQKNRAVLGKIYRQLLFAQVTTEPSVLLVWNPTMQSVLSQALQGRSWQVLAWNTPRVPPTLSPPSRGHFTLRSHLNKTISEKQNKLNNKIIKKKKETKLVNTHCELQHILYPSAFFKTSAAEFYAHCWKVLKEKLSCPHLQ